MVNVDLSFLFYAFLITEITLLDLCSMNLSSLNYNFYFFKVKRKMLMSILKKHLLRYSNYSLKCHLFYIIMNENERHPLKRIVKKWLNANPLSVTIRNNIF